MGAVCVRIACGVVFAASAAAQVEGGAEALLEVAPPRLASSLGGGPAPVDGRVALSLREAIQLGIDRSTDVEIVRIDPEIARMAERAAWGAFEPSLFGQYDFEDSGTPTTNPLQGNSSETSGGSGGLRGLVPLLGWQYQFAYDGSRAVSDGPLTTLRPEYRANFTADLTAPLLKGALYGDAWMEVKLSGIESRLVQEEFRGKLMDIVEEIERAYWSLAAARENLAVADKSLETSRELLRQTQAQLDAGVVSEVEVTEAEAGSADREFRRIEADANHAAAQDALVDAVFGRALTATSTLELVLSDAPEAFTRYETDAAASVQRAFAQRPELLAARERVEQMRIRHKAARNQLLPQLDLVASYGTHGLAGDAVAPAFCGSPPCTPPAGIPDDYAGAHDYFFAGEDSRTVSGGARLTVPLGNTSARANARSASYELEKAAALLVREEQGALLAVRNAVRDVRARLAQVDAAERRRAAAAEQLRTEQLRLEHGKSTPFDVLEREEDVVGAAFQKIIALRDYRVAVAELDRAQGTTLNAHGVKLGDALR